MHHCNLYTVRQKHGYSVKHVFISLIILLDVYNTISQCNVTVIMIVVEVDCCIAVARTRAVVIFFYLAVARIFSGARRDRIRLTAL